ncbi:MAG: hypothetical protein J7L38_01525 [Thermoproteales archaeon]|nr:hypothetical protein [Thermoproteales archaeon]
MWAYPFEFRPPPTAEKDIKFLVKWCEKLGVNKVFFAVRRGIYSFHESKILPQNPQFKGFNLLGKIVKSLHDIGVEVHGMVVVSPWVNLRDKVPSDIDPCPPFLRRRDWLPVDRYGFREDEAPFFGRTYDLDIGQEEVRQFIAEYVRDLIQAVPELDGIHLDFIRYRYWKSTLKIIAGPGSEFRRIPPSPAFIKMTLSRRLLNEEEGLKLAYKIMDVRNAGGPPFKETEIILEREYLYCFCEKCLKNFTDKTGIEFPENLKTTDEKSSWLLEKHKEALIKFRIDNVTDQVRKVRKVMDEEGFNKPLSAATFARFPPHGTTDTKPPSEEDYDKILYTIAQDWTSWAREKLLDFAAPMLYWMPPQNILAATLILKKRTGKDFPLYPGILTADNYKYKPKWLLEAAELLKENNIEGLTLFRYGTWCERVRRNLGMKPIYRYEKTIKRIEE